MIEKLLRIARDPRRWLRWKFHSVGRSRCCYICRNTFGRFFRFRGGWKSVSPFIRELKNVGSDIENFQCPYCSCHDRDRHLVMYFDALQLWERMKDATVLHFAPEENIEIRIEKEKPRVYVKADLSPGKSDIQKIDVTDIPFSDCHFDFIICNHVLEHVLEDRLALSELFRVLKPGGWAVLQTPFSTLLANSFCDPAIDSDDLRKFFYGQEDHVRVYGRDLFSKIGEAGFTLHLKKHDDILSEQDYFYYGVNPKEDLILATR